MTTPGIPDVIYIDGANYVIGPDQIAIKWDDAATAERFEDTFSQEDRPYLGAGTATAGGWPLKIQKAVIAMAFSTQYGQDVDVLTDLSSKAGFFDIALWRPVTERWIGDNSRTVFYTQRRAALSSLGGGFLPSLASTRFATVFTPSSGSPSFNVGTDTVRGTAFVQYSTPPGDLVAVTCRYYPILRVRITQNEQPFELPHREKRVLTLEEI
jgi:hypothetical protein